jgi:hypothetical protein
MIVVETGAAHLKWKNVTTLKDIRLDQLLQHNLHRFYSHSPPTALPVCGLLCFHVGEFGEFCTGFIVFQESRLGGASSDPEIQLKCRSNRMEVFML